ncbi:hypothetical protein HOY80DRAFT_615326 [Tuber brumale]|nr:hypothetical protein HOY80DRAFT_615326 [Tuber brumale]
MPEAVYSRSGAPVGCCEHTTRRSSGPKMFTKPTNSFFSFFSEEEKRSAERKQRALRTPPHRLPRFRFFFNAFFSFHLFSFLCRVFSPRSFCPCQRRNRQTPSFPAAFFFPRHILQGSETGASFHLCQAPDRCRFWDIITLGAQAKPRVENFLKSGNNPASVPKHFLRVQWDDICPRLRKPPPSRHSGFFQDKFGVQMRPSKSCFNIPAYGVEYSSTSQVLLQYILPIKQCFRLNVISCYYTLQRLCSVNMSLYVPSIGNV